MLQMAAGNTLLQTIVDDDKRSRVMAYYTMAFMGMAPLGSLLAGTIADHYSAPLAVRIGGITLVVAAGVFGFTLPQMRELVRPIYVRAGILTEAAAAVQTSSELDVPPEGT